MPELPEAQTIAPQLDRCLRGARLGKVNVRLGKILRGNPGTLRTALPGRVVTGVARRGKRIVLYLDPPYFNPRPQLYSGKFDFQDFWKWMKRQHGSYLLSLNGFVNGDDRRVDVPAHLYGEQSQIEAGTGSLNTDGPVHVTNSLYVRLNGWGQRAS